MDEEGHTTMKKRKCVECASGYYTRIARPGRTAPYRNIAALEIPAELPLFECSECGSRLLDESDIRALDAVLEERYRALVYEHVINALDSISQHTSQRDIERLIGASQGYLSKLRAQDRSPSPELASLLLLLAARTDRVDELRAAWNSGSTTPISTMFRALAAHGKAAYATRIAHEIRDRHTLLFAGID